MNYGRLPVFKHLINILSSDVVKWDFFSKFSNTLFGYTLKQLEPTFLFRYLKYIFQNILQYVWDNLFCTYFLPYLIRLIIDIKNNSGTKIYKYFLPLSIPYNDVPFGMILEGSVICLAHGKILNQDLISASSRIQLLPASLHFWTDADEDNLNERIKWQPADYQDTALLRTARLFFFASFEMRNARELRTSLWRKIGWYIRLSILWKWFKIGMT